MVILSSITYLFIVIRINEIYFDYLQDSFIQVFTDTIIFVDFVCIFLLYGALIWISGVCAVLKSIFIIITFVVL